MRKTLALHILKERYLYALHTCVRLRHMLIYYDMSSLVAFSTHEYDAGFEVFNPTRDQFTIW